MGDTDDVLLKLIDKIFNRFGLQTQSDNPQLSRDYLERFTQLLIQTFRKFPQLQASIVTRIASIVSPYHPSNLLTFEYQLRLIRFSFRQHLQLFSSNPNDFLTTLFHHSHLITSSFIRHLALQIAILIYEQDLHQSFDDALFSYMIELFSPDPNLYVRNTLAQFLALYISKHEQYQLLEQIQKESANTDLLYHLLVLFDDAKQQLLLKQLNVYVNLSDSTAIRAFVLKTAKYVLAEDHIVFYLNRILEKSLSDYVHMLLNIISSRSEHQRANIKLNACLKALFLYIQETEIEEIDENEQTSSVHDENDFGELTEYICCQLYERNVEADDLALIVLDAIRPFIIDSKSFLYKLDFYSSTITRMLTREDTPEKVFAQLIRCLEKLAEFHLLLDSKENLYDTIIHQVKIEKKTTPVYQSLFSLILNTPDSRSYLESINSIVEMLLFQDTDQLLQWDNTDCVLHFLIKLIKSKTNYPSWLSDEFLRRLIEKFVSNNNEYIQGSLIDFLGTLVEHDLLSPFDQYLTSNFIQLTQYSLGDVVRCALAHAWFVILTKASGESTAQKCPFSLGLTTDYPSLLAIVIAQVPLLIGDGGHETEIQCLRLIDFLGKEKNPELENVLEFLLSDGCSKEIKDQAGRLLLSSSTSRTNEDDILEKNTNEILEDELSSVLHWLEHPDEHMILDCD